MGDVSTWAFSLAMFYFIIRNVFILRERNLLRPDLKDEIESLMRNRDVVGVRSLCAAMIV